MKNKAKTYMIFGMVMLVVSIIGSTLAYYTWSTTDAEKIKIVTSIGSAMVYFDGGSTIENAAIRPVESKDYGIIKEIKIKANTTGLKFNLYLDITSLGTGLKDKSFRYQLYKGTTLTKEGNFSDDYLTSNTSSCTVNNTNHIVLLSDETISTSETSYKLYIWIDGLQENPKEMMSETFSFKLHAEGSGALLVEGKIPDITTIPEEQKKTLAYKILSDYYYADKDDISNNSVTYHYDTTNSLMSDTDGNVRYYGASPNNYIYFNCSDYSNQSSSTCETWRIIGIFDGRIKLIRNSNIGSLAWDQDKNDDSSKTTYDNDWSTATLQKLLNGSYYNGTGTVKYYSGSTGKSSTTLDMTSIGIKNDTTRSLIADTTYYLGGGDNSSVYPNQIYEYERGTTVYTERSTEWTGKIALAYPSDYGYAVDLSKCNTILSSYDDSTCTSNNWMKTMFSGSNNWLLTPASRDADQSWYVHSSGYVQYFYDTYHTSNALGCTPVLSLGSELSIKAGTGSSSEPYQLSVN